ncbi:MAG: metal ABC transporter ATP-binding protein [Candidatus Omnitrophota bacterium]|nr:metal ABC transporter ATP-binding protein [Candidatus Omnitrophota bacterium]
MKKEDLIKFKDLSVGHTKNNPVMSGLNVSVPAHGFFGIIGPNGCGKTTLLRTILGIIRPLSGRIIYYSDRRNLHFGYVPQKDTIDPLFPLTVTEIVMMGRYKRIGLFRKPKKEDYRIVQDSLSHCGIKRLGDRLYRELSGGQKQRALIARALASQPDVLILDEPTHNMDLPSEQAVLNLLRDFHQKEMMTIILVSHLIGAVVNFVKSILLIEDGRFLSGDTNTVVTEENLTRLYGLKVKIQEFQDQKFIVVGE